jgi:hypothetical protein
MNDSAADRRSPLGLFPGGSTPRLYDRVVELLRTRHYSRRTEEARLHWIRRFLLFHKGTHPRELAENDVNGFLTHLAVGEKVAASTQNQALAAVLFLTAPSTVCRKPRPASVAGLSGLTTRPKTGRKVIAPGRTR